MTDIPSDSHWEAGLSLEESCDPMVALASQLHSLKTVLRTGWHARGIASPETVAAHSHGVVLWVSWLLKREALRASAQGGSMPSLNAAKALTMAAIHDLPEALTGDLMPSQKRVLFGPDKAVQREAMSRAERRFWERMGTLGGDASEPLAACHGLICEEWTSLWEEYRTGQSPEARLVKRADALDCVMQAMLYRYLHGAPLDVFSRLIAQAAGSDLALETWLRKQWQSDVNV